MIILLQLIYILTRDEDIMMSRMQQFEGHLARAGKGVNRVISSELIASYIELREQGALITDTDVVKIETRINVYTLRTPSAVFQDAFIRSSTESLITRYGERYKALHDYAHNEDRSLIAKLGDIVWDEFVDKNEYSVSYDKCVELIRIEDEVISERNQMRKDDETFVPVFRESF